MFTLAGALAHGQALMTSYRAGELQVGAGYSVAESDYERFRLRGPSFYSSFDFRPHYGVEVDFHQLDQPTNQLYERTYEMGGRYIPKHFGIMTPYAKVLYGRGVLNYPQSVANLAYNMFVAGGGVSVDVKPWLAVRADFEYQQWLSGAGIPNGLTPKVASVQVGYRFGSGKSPGLRWDFPKQAAPKPEKAPKSQPQPAPAVSPAPAPAQPSDAAPATSN